MKTTKPIPGWMGSAEDTAEKAKVKQENTDHLKQRMAIYGKIARPTAKEPAYPLYTRPE